MPGMRGWSQEDEPIAGAPGVAGTSSYGSGDRAAPSETKVRPDYRVEVSHVPVDVDEGALVRFINGAIVAATEHDVESFSEVAPCSGCILDQVRAEAVLVFRTAVAASVAINLDGLEFRGSALSLKRPPDFKQVAWDPASDLILDEVPVESLTGGTWSASSSSSEGRRRGEAGAAPKERWYETRWIKGLVMRKPKVWAAPRCRRLDEERALCTLLGVPPDAEAPEVRSAFLDVLRERRRVRDVAAFEGEHLGENAAEGGGRCTLGKEKAEMHEKDIQSLVMAYRILSRRPKHRPLLHTIYPEEAYSGGLKHDTRAIAFLLRHITDPLRGGRVVKRIEVEGRYAGSIGRARKHIRDSSNADLWLMPQKTPGDLRSDVLLCGKPRALEAAQNSIRRHIAEIAGLKVPQDGVVVMVPPQVLQECAGRPYLPTQTISRIWSDTQTSVHCVDDRVVVRGPRVPLAVAHVQAHLQWRCGVLMPDETRLDAWSYAYLSECAQGAPDPQLVPNTEPDAATVRHIFCLAAAPGTESGDAGAAVAAATALRQEQVPMLGARCLQLTASSVLRLTHTVLRVAVSAAAFSTVCAFPFELQALYLCALLRLWIGKNIRLPLEGFTQHSLTVIVNDLRALLLDPRSGASMRARGYAAVQSFVLGNDTWLRWEQVLLPDGPILNFLREVLMWLRECRPMLGLMPSQWAEIPAIASTILWLCLGDASGISVDLSQGLKRVSAPGTFAPAPPPPGQAHIPQPMPVRARSAPRQSPRNPRSRSRSRRRRRDSGGSKKDKKESKKAGRTSPSCDVDGSHTEDEQELLAQVEDFLLSQTSDAGQTVALARVLKEDGRAIKSPFRGKLSAAWFEGHSTSFVTQAFRDGKAAADKKSARHRDAEWRVRLQPEARATAHDRAQRGYERKCEHERMPLIKEAAGRLEAVRKGEGTLEFAPNMAAALLFLIAQEPGKFELGLAVFISDAFQQGGKKAKMLHKELVPFFPATVISSLAAIDQHRKEGWHENVLCLLLQCAALELHRYTDRPRAGLSTTAETLCRASLPPFRDRIGATVLVGAAALRVEMELSEEFAMEPSGTLFCSFAQTCAWLASVYQSCPMPPLTHGAEVARAFRKLAGPCQALKLRTYAPEGLCRLGQAFDLFVEGCLRQGAVASSAAAAASSDVSERRQFADLIADARAASLSALENIAQCFLAQSVEKADTWSPEQLIIMAQACATMARASGRLVFGHIAAVVERHAHSSVTWGSEQVWLLLRLANNLQLLGSCKQLLQSWDETGALLRYVLAGSTPDLILIFEIARLLESPAVLLGFGGRCSESALRQFSVEDLIGLLELWPAQGGSWDILADFRGTILGAAVASAAAAPCGDLPRRVVHSLLRMAAEHDSATDLLAKLGEAPALLAALPEKGPLAVVGPEAGELVAFFTRRSVKSPLLASSFAALLLTCMTDASMRDLQELYYALQDLTSIDDLHAMPAVVASVAETLVGFCTMGRPQEEPPSEGERLQLLGLLALLMQNIECEVLPEDGDLAMWVDRLEVLAFDLEQEDVASDAALFERLADFAEGGAAADPVMEAAHRALGPRWLEVLLTRSTRLAWCGLPRVRKLPPDPYLATQRLAEAISGITHRDRLSQQTAEWPPVLVVHCDKYGELMETIGGTYVVAGENHGRQVYQRTAPVRDTPVLLYFWGHGDVEERGWWFGPEVGSETAWMGHHSGEDDPPSRGWNWHGGGEDVALTLFRCDDSALKAFAGVTVDSDDEEDNEEAGREAVGVERQVDEVPRGSRSRSVRRDSRLNAPGVGDFLPDVKCEAEHEDDEAQRQTSMEPDGPPDVVKAEADQAEVEELLECDQADEVAEADEDEMEAEAAVEEDEAFEDALQSEGAELENEEEAFEDALEAAEPEREAVLDTSEQLRRRREETTGERQAALREWLLALDKGAGTMLQYFDILCTEFDGDLAQIAATKIEGRPEQGFLGQVDPCFWEVVNVRKMGHRMLFAKGISML
mmetsp:Transcript_47639/g.153191  ORF Transcript_47639/g.153191 Transcript_47639/m.153191 type:complete len:1994 (-) Transcript_47639:80-6061(-)